MWVVEVTKTGVALDEFFTTVAHGKVAHCVVSLIGKVELLMFLLWLLQQCVVAHAKRKRKHTVNAKLCAWRFSVISQIHTNSVSKT